MTEILEFILLTALAVFLFRILYLLVKRLRLNKKLLALGKLSGVEVKRTAPLFLSLLRPSSVAEYTVRLGGKAYLVRLYNGGGYGKAVHYANSRYTVKYSKLATAIYTATRKRGGRAQLTMKGSVSVGGRVIILPELRLPREFTEGEVIPVILFNPAPGEVSYVTEKRNSIRIAFTGDAAWGARIYNLSTFLIHIDREARRLADLKLARETSDEQDLSENDQRDREAFFNLE